MTKRLRPPFNQSQMKVNHISGSDVKYVMVHLDRHWVVVTETAMVQVRS